jgi:hypothetical protein
MSRRFVLALPLLLLVGVARAQDAPPAESLLPVGTQVYLRWDGTDAHKAAWEKTALGKTLQGDTGKFLTTLLTQLQDTLGNFLTTKQLQDGVPPEQIQKISADAADASKIIELLAKNGFLVGIEVRSLEPPQAQLTLVLPDVTGKPAALFALLRLATALGKADVKTKKIEGRSVQALDIEPVHLAWWLEGKHAVFTVGTDDAEAVVKRMADKNEKRLTDNPLFKRVQGFKEFETGARAFVDVPTLLKLARTRGKEIDKLLTDLGLDGLKSIVLYSGFDGLAQRSVVDIEMPGPRKGLLKLAGGKPFTMADIPPIPDDAYSWSMTNFDAASFYDVATQAAESIVKIVSPEDTPKVDEIIKKVNEFAGIDIRKDLLAALGDQVVTYSSPAEGPLILGQSYLFRVKDEKQLRSALDNLVRGIAKSTAIDISVKRRKYRGVELNEVVVKKEGMFLAPTWAIHDGWFVLGFYPQAVQGFVLRSKGEIPSWKPDAATKDSLAKLPKEFTSVSVTDPRPGIKLVLSLAPLGGSLLRGLVKEFDFDVGSIPNGHEATKHLFPNVSVTTDDGKVLRMESRSSVDLPFGAGAELYLLIGAFTAFR